MFIVMRRRQYFIIHHSSVALAIATIVYIYSSLIDAKELQIAQADPVNATTDLLEYTKMLNGTPIGDETVDNDRGSTLLDSSTTPLPPISVLMSTPGRTTETTAISSSLPTSTTTKFTSSFDSEDHTINTPRVVTMRPLIVPTLPDFHRVVHKPYQSKSNHDHHFGPFFEEPSNTSGTLQVGFHFATEAILNCRVGMLKDKTVMWVRKNTDKVSLLTVGNVTYSGDTRIQVKFQYPNNWRLHINAIRNEDSGLYMCQVSTHPPRVFITNLTVLDPAIRLVDEMGHEVTDRYYKLGSVVDITCQVAISFLSMLPPIPPEKNRIVLPSTTTSTTTTTFPFIDTNLIKKSNDIFYNGNHRIKWKKDGKDLPKDIKINLSSTKYWRNSRISFVQAEKSHSGSYACYITNTTLATVNIQILMGETPAAVQHNHGAKTGVHIVAKIFTFYMGLFFSSILHISRL